MDLSCDLPPASIMAPSSVITMVPVAGIVPRSGRHAPQCGFSSDVQFGQRVAMTGIVEKQYVHSLVVGTAGGTASARFSLFMVRMRRNTENATTMKLMMWLTKRPKLMETAPADFAAAREA